MLLEFIFCDVEIDFEMKLSKSQKHLIILNIKFYNDIWVCMNVHSFKEADDP